MAEQNEISADQAVHNQLLEEIGRISREAALTQAHLRVENQVLRQELARVSQELEAARGAAASSCAEPSEW